MNSEPDFRSLRVDSALLQGMTRDVTIYSLTRPAAIIAVSTLSAAVLVYLIVLFFVGAIDREQTARLWPTLLLLTAFIGALVLFTRSSARRALTTAMPEGSTVRVSIGDETLDVVSARGVSSIRYATFRSVRVGQSAVVLRVRGSNVVTAIPRALVDDAGIAQLKARIG